MTKLKAKILRYKATITYIALIVTINSLFSYSPLLCLFNQNFSLGDITVGSIYVFRDLSQREIKHYILLAMLVGGILSYAFAAKAVAFASVMAFLVGEMIDWIIFTLTRKPFSQRLLLSAIASCPVDSWVFLAFINRLHWFEFAVMTVAKFLGVLVVWWYCRFKDSRKEPNMNLYSSA